jgi:salicylate hydroxylase
VPVDAFEKSGGDVKAAFKAYETIRIPRADRVVLSSRELGRIFHVDEVERLVRNAWLKDKTPEEFNHSVRWIYGGNGLTGAKQSAKSERAA